MAAPEVDLTASIEWQKLDVETEETIVDGLQELLMAVCEKNWKKVETFSDVLIGRANAVDSKGFQLLPLVRNLIFASGKSATSYSFPLSFSTADHTALQNFCSLLKKHKEWGSFYSSIDALSSLSLPSACMQELYCFFLRKHSDFDETINQEYIGSFLRKHLEKHFSFSEKELWAKEMSSENSWKVARSVFITFLAEKKFDQSWTQEQIDGYLKDVTDKSRLQIFLQAKLLFGTTEPYLGELLAKSQKDDCDLLLKYFQYLAMICPPLSALRLANFLQYELGDTLYTGQKELPFSILQDEKNIVLIKKETTTGFAWMHEIACIVMNKANKSFIYMREHRFTKDLPHAFFNVLQKVQGVNEIMQPVAIFSYKDEFEKERMSIIWDNSIMTAAAKSDYCPERLEKALRAIHDTGHVHGNISARYIHIQQKEVVLRISEECKEAMSFDYEKDKEELKKLLSSK